MNSMGGLGSHEWRGGYPVHERAERAEEALKSIQSIISEPGALDDLIQVDAILKIISTVLEK